MDKKVKTYLQQIGTLFLLLLFVEYLGGSTLFLHNHTIDGRQIVHSHIYSGSPEEPNHNHTQQQAKLIATLSQIVVLVTATLGFTPIQRHVIAKIAVENILPQSYSAKRHNPLRAPPSLI